MAGWRQEARSCRLECCHSSGGLRNMEAKVTDLIPQGRHRAPIETTIVILVIFSTWCGRWMRRHCPREGRALGG